MPGPLAAAFNQGILGPSTGTAPTTLPLKDVGKSRISSKNEVGKDFLEEEDLPASDRPLPGAESPAEGWQEAERRRKRWSLSGRGRWRET